MVDVVSGSRASNKSRTANGVPLRPLAHLAERSQLSIRWIALSGLASAAHVYKGRWRRSWAGGE